MNTQAIEKKQRIKADEVKTARTDMIIKLIDTNVEDAEAASRIKYGIKYILEMSGRDVINTKQIQESLLG